jgi:basic membrane protein A and related proteins
MRSFKKFAVGITAVAALSFVLAACGSSDSTAGGGSTTDAAPVKPSNCGSADNLCVGMVTDVGKVDDKSFNQSAYDGVKQSGKDLGAQFDYIETTDSKDYATNIKTFVDQKYDVIVTVGFALGEATAKAATDNPKTSFIGVDQFQGKALPNLTGLIFNEDKAGFLAGALAGLITKSDKVGAVLGTNLVPPVVAFKVGYENGAKYSNPKVSVKSTYHPGGLDVAFNDPTFGADTARQMLDQGIDVVFGAGGNTGNGALAEVAKKGGSAFCIGVDTDQWETVPEAHPCLVTSAMKLITPGIVKIIGDIKAGTAKGGNFVGDVGLASYHDFDGKIDAAVKTKIEELTPKVISGEVPTGYKP